VRVLCFVHSASGQKQAKFMDWQRRRVTQQTLPMAGIVSPRVQHLHLQVAEAKAALVQQQYSTASTIVNRCILVSTARLCGNCESRAHRTVLSVTICDARWIFRRSIQT
jgi:hypothetical protein